MEILTRIVDIVFATIPYMVWLSVICVILNTYFISLIIDKIEKVIELKKGKEIKFFDYKKIWIAFFWSLIFILFLCLSNIINIKDSFIYFFFILGLSTFLYDAFLKKYLSKENDV